MSKLIPIYSWKKNTIRFNHGLKSISKEPWFQGILLLACVIVAMLLANLPFTKEGYFDILNTNFQLHLFNDNGDVNILFPRDMTIGKFINDILMVIFFFSVGLEIRREMEIGELSSPKKALMPIIAAFGGVCAPALIYVVVNHGTLASTGWGIPTATDIAFAVCILSVLGDKVPVSLKVFLTALAIADDLIAILVVALFYGGTLRLPLILIAIAVIALTILMRRMGENHIFPYLVMLLIVWVLFYYSGIHATMAGVVMAFLLPSHSRFNKEQFTHKKDVCLRKIYEYEGKDESEEFPNGIQRHYLKSLSFLSRGSMTITSRIEGAISPWVNFLIMPLFALANAGVEISDMSYFNIFQIDPQIGSVGLGIFLGLLLGKPLGITLSSLVAIKCKIGEMPEKANWPMFFAVACLGGIGFTMSIFVDTLSFGNAEPELMEHMRNAGKVAVLMGSICSGVLGSVLVNLFHLLQRRKAQA